MSYNKGDIVLLNRHGEVKFEITEKYPNANNFKKMGSNPNGVCLDEVLKAKSNLYTYKCKSLEVGDVLTVKEDAVLRKV